MACQHETNRRKLDDLTKKNEELYEKLTSGQISSTTQEKLRDMCRAVEMGDYGTASRIRVDMSSTDWDRNKNWLMAIKMLLPK